MQYTYTGLLLKNYTLVNCTFSTADMYRVTVFFKNYRVNFEMSHVHSYCISSKKNVHSYCTDYVLIYTEQSPRAYLFPSFWLFVREALPPEHAADLAQDHPPPAGQPRHA